MGFLGYDHWDFIWASPFLVISLLFRFFWKKYINTNLSSSIYTIVKALIVGIAIWMYTSFLAYMYCFKSGESFQFKDSWKPMIPIIIYFVCMIILVLLANNMPILTTVFNILNFVLNNTLAFYLVGALVWYKILKSSYSDCF